MLNCLFQCETESDFAAFLFNTRSIPQTGHLPGLSLPLPSQPIGQMYFAFDTVAICSFCSSFSSFVVAEFEQEKISRMKKTRLAKTEAEIFMTQICIK